MLHGAVRTLGSAMHQVRAVPPEWFGVDGFSLFALDQQLRERLVARQAADTLAPHLVDAK